MLVLIFNLRNRLIGAMFKHVIFSLLIFLFFVFYVSIDLSMQI